MRKAVLFVLVAAASLLGVVGAPAAQAGPACIGTPGGPACDWVVNGIFDHGETGWTFQRPATVMPVNNPCLNSGSYVGDLPPRTAEYDGQVPLISQRMSIGVGYGTRFYVYFDLFLRNDQNNPWDSFKVTVKDLTVNTVEDRNFYGTGDSRLDDGRECGIEFALSRNYSGHTVELKFSTGAFSTATWQVDDVQLWSIP